MLHGCIEELGEISVQDINTVIEDEKQELHATGEASPSDGRGSAGKDAGKDHAVNVQPLRVENAISNDDRRLLALEKKVDFLEKTLRTDRKRIQRMIMMLALSDDNDKELLDVLKELGAADK
jgi:hypothetical protein